MTDSQAGMQAEKWMLEISRLLSLAEADLTVHTCREAFGAAR